MYFYVPTLVDDFPCLKMNFEHVICFYFRGEESITCLMGLEKRNEEAVCVMIGFMFFVLVF